MAEFVRYKYKCRKCGEVFTGAGGTLSLMPDRLAHAIIGDGQVHMLDIHSCEDCAMGIADLVGADKG